jgi:hypothetical protein
MRTLLRGLPLLAAAVLLAPPLAAQAAAPNPVVVPLQAAAPADVESIDAIVAALYDVISGPPAVPRDWNRLRSLFVPGGRLIPTARRPDGTMAIRPMEVNDYVAMTGPFLERVGFTERELARRTELYGHIAHVFSSYEGQITTEARSIRGINSIQLLNDGNRWWILSVYWEAESPGNPLPAELAGER